MPVDLPGTLAVSFPDGDIPFSDKENARLTRAWGPLWEWLQPQHPGIKASPGALAPGLDLSAQADRIGAALGTGWTRENVPTVAPGGQALLFSRGKDRLAIVTVPGELPTRWQPSMILSTAPVTRVD